MSIKARIALLIGLLSATGLAAVTVTVIAVLAPQFLEYERREAQLNISRIVDLLQSDIDQLDQTVFDWASWDDAYAFVVDRNEEFIQSNLIIDTFKTVDINAMFFFDLEGKTVWGRVIDLESEGSMELPELPDDGLPRGHPLLVHEEGRGPVKGLMQSALGPMLLAARPVLTSEDTGPPRGTMVMGRFLDAGRIESLQERLHIPVRMWGVADPAAGRIGIPEVDALSAGDRFVRARDDSTVEGLVVHSMSVVHRG